MSITYSEFVSVAAGIQHAVRMRHIVICGMTGSNLFLHSLSQTARFWKKKLNIKCVLIFCINFV
jgi:hypothetical protein